MKVCVLVSLRQKFCCSCMADVKKDPYTTIHTNTQMQIHKYKCTNTNTQYVSEYLPVQVWRMSGESIAPNVGVVPSSPFKKPSSGFFFWTNIFSALSQIFRQVPIRKCFGRPSLKMITINLSKGDSNHTGLLSLTTSL